MVTVMEPHGLKPVVPSLPRLVRYGEILSDNFAILVGVIHRHATSAESAVAPRLFTAFIHGLKSRGILRRRINNFSINIIGSKCNDRIGNSSRGQERESLHVPGFWKEIERDDLLNVPAVFNESG